VLKGSSSSRFSKLEQPQQRIHSLLHINRAICLSNSSQQGGGLGIHVFPLHLFIPPHLQDLEPFKLLCTWRYLRHKPHQQLSARPPARTPSQLMGGIGRWRNASYLHSVHVSSSPKQFQKKLNVEIYSTEVRVHQFNAFIDVPVGEG